MEESNPAALYCLLVGAVLISAGSAARAAALLVGVHLILGITGVLAAVATSPARRPAGAIT